ncbi:MAG: glycosyltransferase family 9 protein [candidate division WOR-3 bacterium]
MKILALRLSALGDVILSTPILEYLSKKGVLDFLTYEEYADIFREDPRINRVWRVKRKGLMKLVDILKEQDYDLLVDLQVKPITVFFSKILGVKTIRVDKKTIKRRLHVWFGLDYEGGVVWKRYLKNVADYFGEEPPNTYPKIYPPDVLLPFDIPDNFVAIFPEASTKLKRWDFERFLNVAKVLTDKGINVVWMGKESFPEVDVGLDLRGKTDILQTIKVIGSANLVLSNDSAPVHMARALNIPVVVIMGPTAKTLGFVYEGIRVVEKNLNCRPCSTNGGGRCWRGDRECLNINEFDVISSIFELIRQI